MATTTTRALSEESTKQQWRKSPYRTTTVGAFAPLLFAETVLDSGYSKIY
jgi:hypothetical protein